jgi:feruloyl esterase
MGHKGSPIAVSWAKDNLQGLIDFGYRATHVAALSGKAIAEKFYGTSPKRSYFEGCSTGGYQGITEAQRFPWDFDGIIAGAPDIDGAHANLRGLWIPSAMLAHANGPQLGKEQLTLLHNAVLAACDLDDGVKDGIIGNPQSCKFTPEKLLCKSGESSGCLTASEVETAKKLYAGPTNSAGERISTGGFIVGSELAWATNWPTKSLEDFFVFGIPGYSTNNGWKFTDFDYDRDYKRFGLAAYYDNTNPDLRKFKKAGGKLIVYHGWADTVDLPGAMTDYYETVEKTMGGKKDTQEFFRLYMIPGMNHCGGGVGALQVDWLDYLEAWVEKGKAPDVVTGTHQSDKMNQQIFTRPLYPYPAYAKYKGKGDPNKAESFAPALPH